MNGARTRTNPSHLGPSQGVPGAPSLYPLACASVQECPPSGVRSRARIAWVTPRPESPASREGRRRVPSRLQLAAYGLHWCGVHRGIRPRRAGETTAPWASVRECHSRAAATSAGVHERPTADRRGRAARTVYRGRRISGPHAASTSRSCLAQRHRSRPRDRLVPGRAWAPAAESADRG